MNVSGVSGGNLPQFLRSFSQIIHTHLVGMHLKNVDVYDGNGAGIEMKRADTFSCLQTPRYSRKWLHGKYRIPWSEEEWNSSFIISRMFSTWNLD